MTRYALSGLLIVISSLADCDFMSGSSAFNSSELIISLDSLSIAGFLFSHGSLKPTGFLSSHDSLRPTGFLSSTDSL